MTVVEVDWHQIGDPANRGKLQNHVNQRASRQRKAQRDHDVGRLIIKQWSAKVNARKTSATPPRSDLQEGHQRSVLPPTISPRQTNSNKRRSEDDPIRVVSAANRALLKCRPPELQQEYLINLQPAQHANNCLSQRKRQLPPPGDHRLLTLIYYNVCRGLDWNIGILGLDPKHICLDDYPSPFIPLSPTATSKVTKLPQTLRPTTLQKCLAYHPFLDIFPCSFVRDKCPQDWHDKG